MFFSYKRREELGGKILDFLESCLVGYLKNLEILRAAIIFSFRIKNVVIHKLNNVSQGRSVLLSIFYVIY